jgi:hypothetical protein
VIGQLGNAQYAADKFTNPIDSTASQLRKTCLGKDELLRQNFNVGVTVWIDPTVMYPNLKKYTTF